MMPANHVQSCVCQVTVLSDACLHLWRTNTRASMSNRTLTAVDLTATGVIVNEHFLIVTYKAYFTLSKGSEYFFHHCCQPTSVFNNIYSTYNLNKE